MRHLKNDCTPLFLTVTAIYANNKCYKWPPYYSLEWDKNEKLKYTCIQYTNNSYITILMLLLWMLIWMTQRLQKKPPPRNKKNAENVNMSWIWTVPPFIWQAKTHKTNQIQSQSNQFFELICQFQNKYTHILRNNPKWWPKKCSDTKVFSETFQRQKATLLMISKWDKTAYVKNRPNGKGQDLIEVDN